jgi:hypothetical protein
VSTGVVLLLPPKLHVSHETPKLPQVTLVTVVPGRLPLPVKFAAASTTHVAANPGRRKGDVGRYHVPAGT